MSERTVSVTWAPFRGWMVVDSDRQHSVDGPFARLEAATSRAARYAERHAPDATIRHPLECRCQEAAHS